MFSTNLQVIDGFFVKRTQSAIQSAEYLTIMTHYLQSIYSVRHEFTMYLEIMFMPTVIGWTLNVKTTLNENNFIIRMLYYTSVFYGFVCAVKLCTDNAKLYSSFKLGDYFHSTLLNI